MLHRAILAAVLTATPLLGMGSASAAPSAKLIDVDVIKTAAKPGGSANCSNPGAESGTYALTGWAVQGPKTSTFNTNTLPSNLTLSATVGAFSSAYQAWSQASQAPAISVGTSTSSSTKPTANHSYELMFGRTQGSALAITYTWRWSTGEVESDTIFNSSFSWRNLAAGDGCDESAGNVYDVGNIATHEFGHTYGMDHPAGARFETMYAYGYSGETLKRSLATGDVAGAQAVY
jgi:hypothetical protein